MTKEDIELFNTQVNGLLTVYSENGPYFKDNEVQVEPIKLCLNKMAEVVIPEEEKRTRLFDWMEKHEYWTSPASARYHANFKGGLALHSLMVLFQALSFSKPLLANFNQTKRAENYSITAFDIFISSICHDFCKAGFYATEFRKTKNFEGNWVYEPFYKTKADNRNLGHGNESVLMLLEIMPELVTNRPVIEAISRHMGFSDLSENESYNYSNFLQNPLVILIQLADQTAAQWWDC